MLFLGLRITEWIAIVSFLVGAVYGLMKFYHLFNKMSDTLESLRGTMKDITKQNGDHEKRITSLEFWRDSKEGTHEN